MLAPMRRVLLLVGVVGLCAACHEMTATDQSYASRQAALLAAGGPGVAQICHRTNGAAAFLMLQVSVNAVTAHLKHGDHLPITFYKIGSPTDTVVACEAPPGYSDQPSDCAPVTSFTDGFDGAVLDAKWLFVDFFPAPQLCSGEACSGPQSAAYLTCIARASSWTVAFDFHADGITSEYVVAVFSSGKPGDEHTYTLGYEGDSQGEGVQLIIAEVEPGTGNSLQLTSPLAGGFQVGVRYRLVATASASGAFTLRIFQGSTLVASLDAQQIGPVSVANLGFAMGGVSDGFLTYVDNFSFTSVP
jgi:hypothetical protein